MRPAREILLEAYTAHGGDNRGVPQDVEEAIRWFRRAAEQGDAAAQALLGDGSAQFNIGLMYAFGRGVQQDHYEAVRWYRRAAEQGFADAQLLGVSYDQGQGVPQDCAEAVRWYRRAAEQGLADAQYNLPAAFDDAADLLITSPPYPNRMSYIRELRPYMYWLGFLEDKRQAGELDWLAIGGTWGVATSRAASWKKADDVFFPDYFASMLRRIEDTAASSGRVLSRYVGKYFEDVWRHVRAAMRTMRRGAEMHYVVGNSKFYDVLVPTERIYGDMLLEAGARSVRIDALRKRNSKKELVEFDVVARR